jgi:hypothetical protein
MNIELCEKIKKIHFSYTGAIISVISFIRRIRVLISFAGAIVFFKGKMVTGIIFALLATGVQA